MKFVLLLGIVLVVVRSATATLADNGVGVVPSMETGVVHATMAYENFMHSTYNGMLTRFLVADGRLSAAFACHGSNLKS